MKPEAIRGVAAWMLNHWDSVARSIDPLYQLEGDEVRLLTPLRSDKNRGSFGFNHRSGKWKEFADSSSESSGSDLVSLWAYVQRIHTQGEAAEHAARHFSISNVQQAATHLTTHPEPCSSVPLAQKAAAEEAIPGFAAWAQRQHHAVLPPWVVRDPQGTPVTLRLRCEPPGQKKAVKPAVWDPTHKRWKMGGRAFSRYFYGLERLAQQPSATVHVTEGEKTRDAAQEIFPDMVVLGLMGVGSAGKVDIAPLYGRKVILWPDADPAGIQAMRVLAARLHQAGIEVSIVELPQEILDWVKPGNSEPGGWDLADVPPQGVDLHTCISNAKRWEELALAKTTIHLASKSAIYEERNGGMVYLRNTSNGPLPIVLTNWTGRIEEEICSDDGCSTERSLSIKCRCGSQEFVKVVSAAEFHGGGWLSGLPARFSVSATHGSPAHIREAIKTHSNPSERRVYAQLGWRKIENQWAYLHAGGAIGAGGPLPGLQVNPAEKLEECRLPAPPEGEMRKESIRTSLSMLDLAPDTVMVPVFLSCYRAPLGRASFGLHITGATGSRKSCILAIAQSHFGSTFTFDHLPAKWTSSKAALFYLMHQAKDMLFCVDNLVPQSGKDLEMLFAVAHEVCQAIGDGGIQDVCLDALRLRRPRYPLGLMGSAGEDLPRGHSARARLLILVLEKGRVNLYLLTQLQEDAAEGKLAAAMAAYISWLAPQKEQVERELAAQVKNMRDKFPASHGRTSDAAASLCGAGECFLRFALETEAITPAEAEKLRSRFLAALQGTHQLQTDLQADADPVERFLNLLPSVFLSGRGHLKGIQGHLPQHAERFGWTCPPGGEVRDVKPMGPCLGWMDSDEKTLYLDDESTFAAVDDLAGRCGERIPTSRGTLWKLMRDKKLLVLGENGRIQRKIPRQGNARGLAIRMTSFPAWSEESLPTESENSPEQALSGTE